MLVPLPLALASHRLVDETLVSVVLLTVYGAGFAFAAPAAWFWAPPVGAVSRLAVALLAGVVGGALAVLVAVAAVFAAVVAFS